MGTNLLNPELRRSDINENEVSRFGNPGVTVSANGTEEVGFSRLTELNYDG